MEILQTETDIVLKTLNGSLPVSRFYTSGGSTGGNTFGSKWTGNLETRLIQIVSRNAMDCAIHSAAAQHNLVRRIDDGIHHQCRYVTLYHFDFHTHILP